MVGTYDKDGGADNQKISAWLKATYCNLSAPTSFLSSGAEETDDGGSAPAPRRPIVITVAV